MKQKIYSEKDCVRNISRCKSYERCSINICPLDFNMHLRAKWPEGKICRWMREETQQKVRFRGQKHPTVLKFGGRTMSDDLLKLVPKSMVEKLNKVSCKRWLKIYEF